MSLCVCVSHAYPLPVFPLLSRHPVIRSSLTPHPPTHPATPSPLSLEDFSCADNWEMGLVEQAFKQQMHLIGDLQSSLVQLQRKCDNGSGSSNGGRRSSIRSSNRVFALNADGSMRIGEGSIQQNRVQVGSLYGCPPLQLCTCIATCLSSITFTSMDNCLHSVYLLLIT